MPVSRWPWRPAASSRLTGGRSEDSVASASGAGEPALGAARPAAVTCWKVREVTLDGILTRRALH